MFWIAFAIVIFGVLILETIKIICKTIYDIVKFIKEKNQS
jgi:hypothetical protein